MIRAVLAVLLAAALLAVSLPAIEAAGADRTAAQMDRAVDRVATAATTLQTQDPGPTAGLAPRQVVTVRLPARSLTAARVEQFRIAASEGDTARISYTVAGHPRQSRELAAPIETPAGPVVLRGDGRQQLLLQLVRRDGDPTIRVSDRRPGAVGEATHSITADPVRSPAEPTPQVQIPGRGHADP